MAIRSNDEVCELCLQQAWRDDINDRTRWVLELAAKRINRLNRRCLRLSHQLEVEEARKEATECHWFQNWLHGLTSRAYGTAAHACLILRCSLDAIVRQFRRLQENLVWCIRRYWK